MVQIFYREKNIIIKGDDFYKCHQDFKKGMKEVTQKGYDID